MTSMTAWSANIIRIHLARDNGDERLSAQVSYIYIYIKLQDAHTYDLKIHTTQAKTLGAPIWYNGISKESTAGMASKIDRFPSPWV